MQWRPSALKALVSAPFFVGLALGVGTTFGATLLGSARFSDILPGAFYDAAVGRLADQGVIKGNPDGKFHPGDFMTRAEVAVLIDRAINGDVAPVAPKTRARSSSSSQSTSSSSSSSSVSSVASTEAGSVHFTTTGFNVAKGSKRATITVVRTGGTKGEVKVEYAFGGGTAVVGTDYSATTGTLAFADGESTKNLSVNLMRQELSVQATLEVTLSNVTGGGQLGTPSKAILTLLGVAGGSGSTGGSGGASSSTSSVLGAGVMWFSASAYGVEEKGGAITITVLRKDGSAGAVTVDYTTSDGTAVTGANYSGTQGTLSFAAGETSKTFSVQVADNPNVDGNRKFNLTLKNVTGGAGIGGTGKAEVTLIDDEAVPAAETSSIKFSQPSYTVTEGVGNAVVTVLRQLGVAGTISVNYATNDSSATAISDYTPTSGTLTFAPGETAKIFTVPILKDNLTENEETINLTLSTLTGPAILGDTPTSGIKIQ